MSEQVNKEQTKDANQEKTTELPEGQLDEVVGGTSTLETKSARVPPQLEMEALPGF